MDLYLSRMSLVVRRGVSPAQAGMDRRILRHRMRRTHGVSPAQAGMDLSRVDYLSDGRLGCFPRTGGDGPLVTLWPWRRTPDHQFPPHRRGWTVHGPGPARGRSRPCFPRTGGDGPAIRNDANGWASVSPAQAGMDLPTPAAVLPRPLFPPHRRGWTVSPGRPIPLRELGFPRTGGDGPVILPSPMLVRASFPRTGGDGPFYGQSRRRERLVSFPRTGGDGPQRRHRRSRVRFPRTGGDGPLWCCRWEPCPPQAGMAWNVA